MDSNSTQTQLVVRLSGYVQDVKRSVAELRVAVKQAAAYREKCSLLLSAAMGVTLALDQVWHAVCRRLSIAMAMIGEHAQCCHCCTC